MKEFWNNRYQQAEYVYGTDAKQFLIENITKL